MRGDGIRVLVVGAGLAGLSLVHALRDWGAEIHVVERLAGPAPAGSGIYLPGNATRALRELGLLDPVADIAVRIERQRTATSRGRRLFEVDVDGMWRDVGPCLALHRSELHRRLLDALEGQPVRWGLTPMSLTAVGSRTLVEFNDGSSDIYDLIIGADGVHSTVRRLAFGDGLARRLDQYAYRFLAPRTDTDTAWSVQLGPGIQFLTIPINGRQLYCYLNTGPGGARSDWREVALAMFAEPVPTLLGQTDGRGHAGPNEEVVLPTWIRGTVLLVGDAAHACSPNMAQGAAMAFEDAIVLAESLRQAADIPAALAAFQTRRRPRTDWVLAQTRRRDRSIGLPSAVRNPLLSAYGQRIFRDNYAPLLGRP
ncbi:FAD-dependent monooxygenase [Micromonospora sp. WMMD1082]|uniref:FAD-dependent monooxygenase n=1 Tax=Micromonospora sp. WMMD1082 TaxID=3016104 RepID=UPI002416EF8A|nr:FAD-dependent monooxygenase [Micromonospora sp. WMMD1082]MDG4795725.1 FAD-dependent monooxygenase [Micromonospora sp. WMMD1082]